MRKGRIFALAIVVIVFGIVLFPTDASADGLTGSIGITWLYPDTSTVFAADSIDVGSTLSCPGVSAICYGYFPSPGNISFSVDPSSIAYAASGTDNSYDGTEFNGFDFSGLTFADGSSLVGFSLTTNIDGLTDSDVNFGPSFIEINLSDLPADGYFTLSLTPGKENVPEPSTILLLGIGLISLAAIRAGLVSRRRTERR